MLLRRVSVWSVLLLSLGGVVAFAKPKSLTPQLTQNVLGQPRQDWDEQRLIQELNLSEEQKQQLQAIEQHYRGQMNQQYQKLLPAQQELGGLMAGTASQSQIRDKYRQVEALRQQLGGLRLECMLAMREVLTPTQRSRYAQLMQQRQENFSVKRSYRYGNHQENRRGSEG